MQNVTNQVNEIISSSTTTASDDGVIINYDELRLLEDNMHSDINSVYNEQREQWAIQNPQEQKALKTRLTIKQIKRLGHGNARDCVLLGYVYLLQNPLIKKAVNNGKLEIKIEELRCELADEGNDANNPEIEGGDIDEKEEKENRDNELSEEHFNTAILKLTYKEEIRFWDVQHDVFVNNTDDLKCILYTIPATFQRKNTLTPKNNIFAARVDHIDLTEQYNFKPIKNNQLIQHMLEKDLLLAIDEPSKSPCAKCLRCCS